MGISEGDLCLTRAGSKVVIYTDKGKGDRPIIGAYFSGEEWVPSTWRDNGRFNTEAERALDLMLPNA
jgi:hypothetical protein